MPNNAYIGIKEACLLIGRSRTTVIYWIKTGKVRYKQQTRTFFVHKQDIFEVNSSNIQQYLPASDLAQLYNVSLQAIHYLIKNGIVRWLKVNRFKLVYKDDCSTIYHDSQERPGPRTKL